MPINTLTDLHFFFFKGAFIKFYPTSIEHKPSISSAIKLISPLKSLSFSIGEVFTGQIIYTSLTVLFYFWKGRLFERGVLSPNTFSGAGRLLHVDTRCLLECDSGRLFHHLRGLLAKSMVKTSF